MLLLAGFLRVRLLCSESLSKLRFFSGKMLALDLAVAPAIKDLYLRQSVVRTRRSSIRLEAKKYLYDIQQAA